MEGFAEYSDHEHSLTGEDNADPLVEELFNPTNSEACLPLLCWPTSQRIWEDIPDEWGQDDEIGIARRPVPQFLEEEIPSQELIEKYESDYSYFLRRRIEEKLNNPYDPLPVQPVEATLNPPIVPHSSSFFGVFESDDAPPVHPFIDASLSVHDLRKMLLLQPDEDSNNSLVAFFEQLKQFVHDEHGPSLSEQDQAILRSLLKGGGATDDEIDEFLDDPQNQHELIQHLVSSMCGMPDVMNTALPAQNDTSEDPSPISSSPKSSATTDSHDESVSPKPLQLNTACVPSNHHVSHTFQHSLHHRRPPALLTPRDPFRQVIVPVDSEPSSAPPSQTITPTSVPPHIQHEDQELILTTQTPVIQDSSPRWQSSILQSQETQHTPHSPFVNGILSPSFISRLASIIPTGSANHRQHHLRTGTTESDTEPAVLQSGAASTDTSVHSTPRLPPSPPPTSPITATKTMLAGNAIVTPSTATTNAVHSANIPETVIPNTTSTTYGMPFPSPIVIPDSILPEEDKLTGDSEQEEEEEGEKEHEEEEEGEKEQEAEASPIPTDTIASAAIDAHLLHSAVATRTVSAPRLVSLPNHARFTYRQPSDQPMSLYPPNVTLPPPHPPSWLEFVSQPELVDGKIFIPQIYLQNRAESEEEEEARSEEEEVKQNPKQKTKQKTGTGGRGGKNKKKLSKKQRKKQKKQQELDSLRDLAKLKASDQPHSTPSRKRSHPRSRLPKQCPICSHQSLDSFNLRIISAPFATGIEDNSDLAVQPNQVLAGRFVVREQIGSAAFSKAVECDDLETGDVVCMKVIKNNKEYFDQSIDEIKLLSYVNRHDPDDRFHIVRMLDFFYFKEHLIIMCELLKQNLYEFQKDLMDNDQPSYFTIPRLQKITRQVLESLAFLHSLGLIHCDLKPENILIQSYSRCEVKVIDLGSSCFVTDPLTFYTQSRSYRAPEVILGIPYGTKIDIWSLGCIITEMLTGRVLFVHESLPTLLGSMIGILGPFSEDFLQKAKFRYRYFTTHGILYDMEEDPETDRQQFFFVHPKQTTLKARLETDDDLLIDFVSRLLTVDPDLRPSALEALQHPWFNVDYGEYD
ncbi:putative DYRK-family kinase pom1 [Blattamonas nauphoetae]|uniref:DYRK-family kinase pom1 n=1 Tax=Blattamonas nauphoetae TaxID=2049346 RepID=A0ABQ9YKD5_9EUKA|nr:putative DYRK-family kinase pom1 [Blattamonas nauphoetae]